MSILIAALLAAASFLTANPATGNALLPSGVYQPADAIPPTGPRNGPPVHVQPGTGRS